MSETRAPVNTDGARPNNDTLEKHLTAINDLVARPPITLSVANTVYYPVILSHVHWNTHKPLSAGIIGRPDTYSGRRWN